MKWLDDKPSAEFRSRVMQAAEGELAKHQSTSGQRMWLLRWAAAATLCVAGVLAYREMSNEKPSVDLAESDPEMFNELALIEDLEFWQNLDEIERWKKEGA